MSHRSKVARSAACVVHNLQAVQSQSEAAEMAPKAAAKMAAKAKAAPKMAAKAKAAPKMAPKAKAAPKMAPKAKAAPRPRVRRRTQIQIHADNKAMVDAMFPALRDWLLEEFMTLKAWNARWGCRYPRSLRKFVADFLREVMDNH